MIGKFLTGAGKVFATVGLLAVAAPATAAKWMDVTTDKRGAKISMDVESYRVRSSVAEFWVRYDYSNVPAVAHRESRFLWRFKCADRTITEASSIDYATDGRVLRSNTEPEYSQRWSAIIPDSIADVFKEIACEGDTPRAYQ